MADTVCKIRKYFPLCQIFFPKMFENTYFLRFLRKTFGYYRKKSYLCTRKIIIISRSGAVGSSPGS